jgi:translation elongation factor EF-G
MDTRPDEKDRGITIKSTAISLFAQFYFLRCASLTCHQDTLNFPTRI